MKKREKPPEVAAFEQAFDGAASGAPSPFARSQVQPSPFAPRPPGQTPGSYPSARVSGPSSPLRAALPGQPFGRRTGPGSAPGWGEDDEVGLEEEGYYAEEDEPEAPWAGRKRPTTPPRAGNDRFSTILVRAALVIVALIAAYSLESHSHRHYFPGTISGATVSNISFDAGWPLTYAPVNEQQVALSEVDPTPAFHYISPVKLAVDVLLLAVPFWLLLEAVWLFWVFLLERFGPRGLIGRFFAIGFTALPATLWMVGALAAGIFVGFSGGSLSALPKFALPALLPAVPGFGLAAGASLVLGVPPALWTHDFGVFLLAVALPLILLTACLYLVFCLIGRGARKLLKRH